MEMSERKDATPYSKSDWTVRGIPIGNSNIKNQQHESEYTESIDIVNHNNAIISVRCYMGSRKGVSNNR